MLTANGRTDGRNCRIARWIHGEMRRRDKIKKNEKRQTSPVHSEPPQVYGVIG